MISMKNSNDTIGDPTRDLPARSAVHQLTTPPRAPKYMLVFMQNTRKSFSILVEFYFFPIFSKNIQISNFIKIRQVGSELLPCGQTDRHNEPNSRSSQFCERF